MQGTIDQVKQWPDGGISLQVGGQWYKTKNVELLSMQGATITFIPAPWTNPNTQKVTNYINDYQDAATPTTPAGQQAAGHMPRAEYPPVSAYADVPQGQPYQPQVTHPSQLPVVTAENPSIDRDASIVAQALTKSSCTPGDPVEAVWERYTRFYHLYMGGAWTKDW